MFPVRLLKIDTVSLPTQISPVEWNLSSYLEQKLASSTL